MQGSHRLTGPLLWVLVLILSGAPALGEAPTDLLPPECGSLAGAPPPSTLRPCEPWLEGWGPGGKNYTHLHDALVSPDGARVYTLGHAGWSSSTGDEGHSEMFVLARDAATGTLLWTFRYEGELERHTFAISPAGGRLYFVISHAHAEPEPSLFALDARTGALLWERAHPQGSDSYEKILIDSSGLRLYLLSYVGGVQAYDALTGAPLWDTADGAPERALDAALPDEVPLRFSEDGLGFNPDAALASDGTRLVTTSFDWPQWVQIRTYDTATGIILWDRDVYPEDHDAFRWAPTYAAVGPEGARAYALVSLPDGFTLLTLSLADGSLLDRDHVKLDGPWDGCWASGLQLSPNGTRAYGAGTCHRYDNGWHLETVVFAEDTATGERAWTHVQPGMWHFGDFDMSPDGKTLYAVNHGGLLAFDAATGGVAWTTYDTWEGENTLYPYAAAVAPGSARLYLVGDRALDDSDAGWAWSHDVEA